MKKIRLIAMCAAMLITNGGSFAYTDQLRIAPIETASPRSVVKTWPLLGLAKVRSRNKRLPRADELFWIMEAPPVRPDNDWYALGRLEQNEKFKFAAQFAAKFTLMEINVEIWTGGHAIASARGTPTVAARVTVPQDGEYFLRVWPSRPAAGVPYVLDFSTSADDPEVEVVEVEPNDGRRDAMPIKSGQKIRATFTPRNVPEPITRDTFSGFQWSLESMNAISAVGRFHPSSDVVVAVIDTGVALSHPDLEDALVTLPGEIPHNGIDDNGDGAVDNLHGINVESNTRGRFTEPIDDNGHGTHVATTIAALTGNDEGIAGIAPGIHVVAIKAFSSQGAGRFDDILDGLETIAYWKANLGVPIVVTSNSWGASDPTRSFTPALLRAFGRLSELGIIHVASAGNSGLNLDLDFVNVVPAELPLDSMFAVAAVDRFDQLAWFSNYGSRAVEIAAPGVDVLAGAPVNGYYVLSGTSMSCPHISGAVAAYLSEFGQTDPLALRAAMRRATRRVDALQDKVAYGGILDLEKFLNGGE